MNIGNMYTCYYLYIHFFFSNKASILIHFKYIYHTKKYDGLRIIKYTAFKMINNIWLLMIISLIDLYMNHLNKE